MLEYMIYRQNSGGKPFCLKTYDNLEAVKSDLYNMITNNISLGYSYYVDNDFFDNKYNIQMKIDFYYCIKVREVYEWKIYSESSQKSNILYHNFN